MSKANHQNKLADESSPYLLQHAHNPVNWFPWGDEAFELAKKEDKPVMVSIGYATCHWCHVMAHESFEDEAIAELLNDAFINIKVDREERPDIDNTYMFVCQMLSGSGGWPLNVWLTPEKQPFYAATYIPKTGRHGRPGMDQLIPRLSELWQNEREKITNTTDEISNAFQQSIQLPQGKQLDSTILDKAYQQYTSRYDEQYGGFGSEPKFPSPHNLMLLLRYAKSHPDSKALEMVENTLAKMRLGGLFDQIGFGFHRYSTDQQWLVPHFEKMLYDQAMLLMAYTEGWQLTKNDLFKETAEEISQYLNRKMRNEHGGFYSAEDADSEGEEGKFYVWSTDEIKELLTKDEADLFIKTFNLKHEGNYHDESTGQLTGKNIPYLAQPISELATEFDANPSSLNQQLKSIRKKLLDKRAERVHPLLDDKILTDWNGLIMAALAKAGRVFQNSDYIDQAENCYQFIKAHMFDENDRLLHRWRQDESGISAFADDYAFFIWGLIELYEATFETAYLQKAVSLNEAFIEHFWDQQQGGFYTSQENSEELMGRKKEFYDGALPSANSVAMLNLLRLGRITGNTDWETMADEINQLFSPQVKKAPTGFGFALQSVAFTHQPKEIIIVGRKNENETQKMLEVINEHYLPNAVVLFKDSRNDAIVETAPYLANFSMKNEKPTAYVCENYRCDRPVHTASALSEMIS